MCLAALQRAHWKMHKAVIVADASLRRRPTRHQKLTGPRDALTTPPQLQQLLPYFKSWVPLDYTVAQLTQDAARYWHVQLSECHLVDDRDNLLDPRVSLESVVRNSGAPTPQFTLKRATRTVPSRCPSQSSWSLSTKPEQSIAGANPRAVESDSLDPFCVQEKLFELFLYYALQNVSSRTLRVTSYQFKSLLQRAVNHRRSISNLSCSSLSSSIALTKAHREATGSKHKTTPHAGFGTRVLLAFRGAVVHSGSGVGATFDEFLDALVDVASILFPNAASRAVAFETLATEVVIPHFEQQQYAGGVSALSWPQMDVLLATTEAGSLIQRFARAVGDLAASYSTTIGGSRACRGLQFHELGKFVHELKLQSLAVSSSELCEVFIRCCRTELREQFSDAATLTSLYFTSSTSLLGSGNGGQAPSLDSSSRTGSARGHFTTHGGGERGNATAEMGGVLEIVCSKVMRVFGYVALMKAPAVATMKDGRRRAATDFTSLRLDKLTSGKLAVLSLKALLQHIANHLSGKCAAQQHQQLYHYRHSTKHSAAFELASVQFLNEFQKLHVDDGMADYLSDFSSEIQRCASSEHSKQEKTAALNAGNARSIEESRADPALDGTSADDDVDCNSGGRGGDSDESESDMESVSVVTPIDPQVLQAMRLRELDELDGELNAGDEIFSFLASELQRRAVLGRCVDNDADLVAQMLDMWVAAGQRYAQAIADLDATAPESSANGHTAASDALVRGRASVVQRFASSLYVFASQLLHSTTRVYAYETVFSVTNARVYSVSAECWDDTGSVFTKDLAMETLSLASAKFSDACETLLTLLEHSSLEADELRKETNDYEASAVANEPQQPASPSELYGKCMECLFLRASCLTAYGDILAHNRVCEQDYELGCVVEDELERLHTGATTEPSRSSAHFPAYRSELVLSKASTPGHFYCEANRILRFVQDHTLAFAPSAFKWTTLQGHKVHLARAMTQFKLATHLPRGCVAEKKLLEAALVHLAVCQKCESLRAENADAIADKKEYISAILVLRQRFFQPEGPRTATPRADPTDDLGEQPQHSCVTEELVSPFYRFILAAAFKDFDNDNSGVLTLPQLSKLNSACGRGSVAEATMQWLLRNFDSHGGGVTEKGLLQYFCWIAEAGGCTRTPSTRLLAHLSVDCARAVLSLSVCPDPVAFCEILDVFMSKYTETHHASITTSRPASISREPKAKSLRSIVRPVYCLV